MENETAYEGEGRSMTVACRHEAPTGQLLADNMTARRHMEVRPTLDATHYHNGSVPSDHRHVLDVRRNEVLGN